MEHIIKLLTEANADYEIIQHAKPILSTMDAEGIFDINKSAPIFILKTEIGYIAFIVSGQTGKINFKSIKQELGIKKLSMASREEVLEQTGFEAGAVPLIGHNMPTVIEKKVLETDYVYGGTGDPYHTLKINPVDLQRINNTIKVLKIEQNHG